MSMNEADILSGCILDIVDDENAARLVHKLHDLADPNADRIRDLEKQLAESVPKKSIEKMVKNGREKCKFLDAGVSCMPFQATAVRATLSAFEKLLTPPAKEK